MTAGEFAATVNDCVLGCV